MKPYRLNRSIPGYLVQEELSSSDKIVLLRALRQCDNRHVIIKCFNHETPLLSDISQLKQEYLLTRHLDIEGIVKPLDLVEFGNNLGLVLEDSGRIRLSRFLQEYSPGLEQFLYIAIQVAETLGGLHSYNIIHQRINPRTILIDQESFLIRIADFSCAAVVQVATKLLPIETFNGSFHYISPEQTGRVSFSMDYRTDLYSLGITLYEILVGHPPYEEPDSMSLVFAHIAKTVEWPASVKEEIPPVILDIVFRCLQKAPEDRYQSAFGLKSDLEKCRLELASGKPLHRFELGINDVSASFQLPPDTLYGRKTVLDTLLSSFESATVNYPQLILLSGPAGIGKTALLKVFTKTVNLNQTRVLKSTFDQYQRHIPFSGFKDAFHPLIKQLLSEEETVVTAMKSRLKTMLGPCASILVSVIPDLRYLLEDETSSGLEAETTPSNLIQNLLCTLIAEFCTETSPLLIVLDDLQWADRASLILIKYLLVDRGIPNTQIVGTYRNTEITSTHILMNTLHEIQDAGVSVNTILLTPLTKTEVMQLLSNTFNKEAPSLVGFCEYIYGFTGGVPLLIMEILQTLHNRHMIQFDMESGSWMPDTASLEILGMSEQVLELMQEKLQEVSSDLKELLFLGACIGLKFKLEIITNLSTLPEDLVVGYLYSSLKEGFLVQEADQGYRFAHTRVRQAILESKTEEEQHQTHYRIGMLMLNYMDKSRDFLIAQDISISLFQAVAQLNLAEPVITEHVDRITIARLNLKVAEQARLSGSFVEMQRFSYSGIKFLDDNLWETNQELAFKLYLLLAESHYLCSDKQSAVGYFKLLSHLAPDRDELTRVHSLEMDVYLSEGDRDAALRVGLECLHHYGVNLKRNPSRLSILMKLLTVRRRTGTKKVSDFINLPEMTDPKKRVVVKLLTRLAACAYFADRKLYSLIALTIANYSLKFGVSEYSSIGFCIYAVILSSQLNNWELGYQYGQLSKALNIKYQQEAKSVEGNVIYGSTLVHLSEPFSVNIQVLKETYKNALDFGEPNFAAYAINNSICAMFFKGDNLISLQNEIEYHKDFLLKLNYPAVLYQNYYLMQLIRNLREATNERLHFDFFAFDEAETEAAMSRGQDFHSLHLCWLLKAIGYLFFEDYTKARRIMEKSLQFRVYSPGLIEFYLQDFYYAIILLKGGPLKGYVRVRVRMLLKNLERWATFSPNNFSHHFELVNAEYLRQSGSEGEALKRYSKAISLAESEGCFSIAGLASVYLGDYLISLNLTEMAAVYIKKSVYYFERWGALAMVNRLKTMYFLFFVEDSPSGKPEQAPVDLNSTFDLMSILYSSQSIAMETKPDRLLEELLRQVLKNAGAKRALILLRDKTSNQFFVEAEATCDPFCVSGLLRIPFESYPSISKSLVHYCIGTGETMILGDAFNQESFGDDPYIRTGKLKSMLVMPLMLHGEVLGILVLENSDSTGVFTSDRVGVLKLLASQSAIALENADLISNLEQKVAARTRDLTAAQTKILTLERHQAENQMAGGFAHEIRNSLAGIKLIQDKLYQAETDLNYSMDTCKRLQSIYELLNKRVDPELRGEVLSIMKQIYKNEKDVESFLALSEVSLKRALSITTQIMEFSRIGQEKLSGELIVVDEVISTLVSEERYLLDSDSVSVEVDLNAGDIKLSCKSDFLYSIVNNLVLNALDAIMERKGSEPDLRPELRIQTQIVNDNIEIEVSDNGNGIAPENMDRIFNTFFSTKPKTGTGLGLGMVRRYVDLLDGSIGVKSEKGSGTTFTIQLPGMRLNPDNAVGI